MRESYQLQDIIRDLIGRVSSAADSGIDGEIKNRLKFALPELFDTMSFVFDETPYEVGSCYGSVDEIGTIKLEWAREFKSYFDYIVGECSNEDDETTVS